MFGKNSWTDRLKEKLTVYIDEQFVEYRERLANDLARGVGALAILAVKWTLFLLILFFGAALMAFLLAELLRPLVASWAYVSGFGIVLLILMVFLAWISRKLSWMENRVFEDIRTALLEEEPEALVAEEALVDKEKTTQEKSDAIELNIEPNEILNIENPEIEELKKKKDPFRDL